MTAAREHRSDDGIGAGLRLAFSIVENPGVYALILGSGISRSAGIPTGWEITLDLVRRVAAAEGVFDAPDWAEWHRARFGTEPGYSDLLDRLTTVPSERRSIVRSYIEPGDEDEGSTGDRRPTPAHAAIARLVRDGWIRVIVTTNFDRLMETALADAGVQPVVIRSIDDLAGAPPFHHVRCSVLKLHGDYLDDRILNTDAELAGCPPSYDALLDRILDEHGLVVVGWSGDHIAPRALTQCDCIKPSIHAPSRYVFSLQFRDTKAKASLKLALLPFCYFAIT